MLPLSIKPRFGSIKQAQAYSGRGRSRLYELAAENPGLFRKDGNSTLVDFAILDQILDALPQFSSGGRVGRP